VSESIVNTFLRRLEGLEGNNGARVFFIAATNYPGKIDGAIMRRFKKRVFFDLPENADRAEMIHNSIADFARNLAKPAQVQTGPKGANCERSEQFQPFLEQDGRISAFHELVLGPGSHTEDTNRELKGLVIPLKEDGAVNSEELDKIKLTHEEKEIVGEKRDNLRKNY
jgi:SpoVK/Ycf46/Vps4 family AAA+-type ATPase